MAERRRGLRIAEGIELPLGEIEVRASRSGGPGGQHANKTASRIEASFEIGSSDALTDPQKDRLRSRLGPRVTAVAQETRSQARNRELALARLEARLADAMRSRKRRRASRATKASKRRRLEGKRRRSELKRSRRKPSAEG